MLSRLPRRPHQPINGLAIVRIFVLGLARAVIPFLTAASAQPIRRYSDSQEHDDEDDTSLWVLYLASLALVLLGGAFAGLTIALMGQDSIYLQVLAEDIDPQSNNARRVFDLLQRGKHWVLVTLLLSNVIVNETLPVVLDRCLGGGVAAVLGSTLLIVIFGEILPQSVCVRYGLQIGGFMSKPVLVLMYILAPLGWPTAKLLDWLLGEDHGTVYKKSGLKTLVGLHQSIGDANERLNKDEVTIISAVLDLKEKQVGTVMTPMEDVFVLSEDTILDEDTMDRILSEGYSRIPIHAAGAATNFVGMLLVKILITYDPEDCRRIREFSLATLPETRPETSCLDIVNFFQEGKSHMVLVSETPGEDHGALGVVTLEDVIEELIGEEIIDESDVYVDVHKAIRRLNPAPKARGPKPLRPSNPPVFDEPGDTPAPDTRLGYLDPQMDGADRSKSPRGKITFMLRRSSVGPDGIPTTLAVPIKANLEEMKHQLKHLGPSNPATNPKNTRSTAVKIKHGIAVPLTLIMTDPNGGSRGDSVDGEAAADERTSLLGASKAAASNGDKSFIIGDVTRQSVSMVADQVADIMMDIVAASGVVDKADDIAAHRPNRAASAALSRKSKGAQASVSLLPQSTSATSSPQSMFSATSKRELATHLRAGSLTESVIQTGDVQKIVIQTSNGMELVPDLGTADEVDPSDEADTLSPSLAGTAADAGLAQDGAGSECGRKKQRRKHRRKPGV